MHVCVHVLCVHVCLLILNHIMLLYPFANMTTRLVLAFLSWRLSVSEPSVFSRMHRCTCIFCNYVCIYANSNVCSNVYVYA
jgi:hypothetical protein